jgi:TPR repeat protein
MADRVCENRLEGDVMAGRIALYALVLALVATCPAMAGSSQDGVAALRRHDYAAAIAIFGPLAGRGDARAQTYLGFMYANGYGVPQNYIEAANWLRLASERGYARAQYALGLMYDKGHGVPQDYVQAYKWLDLAVARATGRERDDWVRIRDAVASKLSLAQRTEAQALAIEWQAQRGR